MNFEVLYDIQTESRNHPSVLEVCASAQASHASIGAVRLLFHTSAVKQRTFPSRHLLILAVHCVTVTAQHVFHHYIALSSWEWEWEWKSLNDDDPCKRPQDILSTGAHVAVYFLSPPLPPYQSVTQTYAHRPRAIIKACPPSSRTSGFQASKY